MATINGTSGNDTLSTITFQNDDFFGFGGNDIYNYVLDGGDDTITDSAGNDELHFGAGIDRYVLSFNRIGNDLIVRTAEAGNITIINHFLSSSNKVETISFSSQSNIDLTATNILVQEKDQYGMYTPLYGANNAEIIYGGMTQAEYDAINNDFNYIPSIIAGGGDDYIYANIAKIFAGDGNDVIYSNMVVYAGYGDDTFYSTGPMNSQGAFFGEQGNDTAYGSEEYDQLRGDEGDDLIYGYGGDDALFGGDGDDTIYGGDGNDSIVADGYNYPFTTIGVGNDTLYGGSGNDTIETGAGHDIAYGEDGDDYIIAGSSFETWSGVKEYYGGAGDDYIENGSDDDILVGGSDDDTILAIHGGNNFVYGDDGNDQISVFTAVYEENNVDAGDGNDLITYGGRSVSYPGGAFWGGQGTAYLNGGNGNDIYATNFVNPNQDIGTTYIFDESGSADAFDLFAHASQDITFSVIGTNLIVKYLSNYTGSVVVTDFFIPQHRIESFIFSNKTTSLFETLTNASNSYTATSTTSKLGTNQNLIEALDGNDVINAGVGDDIVFGGNGADTLNGQGDNDSLYGEAGNDTLRGGTGDDILDGGSGADTASYSTATGAVVVNLATGTSSGADGSDTFISIEDIAGSNYNDTLTGDANNNTISGGSGNDTVYGGAGADILYGGSGADFLYGEDGDDTLYGGAGNDTMNGGNGVDTVDYSGSTAGVSVNLSLTTAQNTVGEGTDTLSNIENLNGSNFNDTLTGTSGANIIRGNTGNDTINAGAGNDILIGGDGNDTLNGGDNDDFIYGGLGDDIINGGNGIDTMSYFTSATAVFVNLGASSPQATGEGNDTITNVENVEGSVFADIITGNVLDNILSGMSGDDTLYGGGGADILYGNSGSDTFLLKGETAFGASTTIADYTTGNDAINIHDVLSDFGYSGTAPVLDQWIRSVNSGPDSILEIDRDGTGSSYGWQAVATISNNTNLDLDALISSGNLVV